MIRGNLLIIPIEHSFIYVEPIYLQSEQGQLPQLKRVIAVHDGELAMGRNLDDALSAVFAIEGTPKAQQQEAIAGGPVTGTLSSLARQALAHYNKAKEYLRNADWSKYGDEFNQLETILKKMNPKKGKAPGKAPRAPATPAPPGR